MKTPTCMVAALLLGASLLAGCATYDGIVYPAYYNAYYDGFYGPYSGGYWAADGYFWYLGPNQRYYRDSGSHFRRQRFPDSRHVRGDHGWPKNNPPPGNPAGPHARPYLPGSTPPPHR